MTITTKRQWIAADDAKEISVEQQIARAVRNRLNLPIEDAPNELGCRKPKMPPRPFLKLKAKKSS